MKLYIAVRDEFPDYMTPTLVAHSVLDAHKVFESDSNYIDWFTNSFKKVVVRVNAAEWEKIIALPGVHLGHEIHTFDGQKACAVVCPSPNPIPNVLKFAKLWAPRSTSP